MRALMTVAVVSCLVSTVGAAPKKKALPPKPKAIVLVIDKSGSMQGPRLEAAKDAAKATLDALRVGDWFSLVAFDSEAIVFIKAQRIGKRDAIKAEIDRLASGGGTNIFPGLKAANEVLDAIKDVGRKHVLLLSDGEAPSEGIEDLVKEMNKAKVTVSAVGIPSADRNLLSLIADAGAGRLYMVEDIGALPKIFAKEMQEVR